MKCKFRGNVKSGNVKSVKIQHYFYENVARTLQKMRKSVGKQSMGTNSGYYCTLLTATYVVQQYKGNSQLHFHGNNGYANTPQSYVICKLTILLIHTQLTITYKLTTVLQKQNTRFEIITK